MAVLFSDTTPKAKEVLISLMGQAPAWRKLQMTCQLTQTVRTLALHGLRRRHPLADEDRLRRHLADILLGAELAEKVDR